MSPFLPVHGEVMLVRTAGEKPIAWFFEKRRQVDEEAAPSARDFRQ
ncbi:hypothetical protein [Mesorhizobium sp. LNJC380A00]|nr:hypothetical protein [Mesorhizobium sp. LNJC380A00]